MKPSVDPTIPTQIDATFMPAGGESLIPQAQALCGVNHFNWLQNIVTIPDNWQYEVIQFPPAGTEGTISAFPVSPPIIDPIVEPLPFIQTTLYAIGVNGGGQVPPNSTSLPPDTVLIPVNSDDKIYYYNEDRSNDSIALHTYSYKITFVDQPKSPIWAMPPGGFEQFETSLVGVSASGTPQALSGVGFNWSSNTVYVGDDIQPTLLGNVWIDSTFPSSIGTPSTLEGGIFNIQPETGAPTIRIPPTLAAIASETVNAGGLITVTAAAIDTNPGAVLTFSLDPRAPVGALIDPKTGKLTWNVPASQPPSVYSVTVRVSDNGTPPLSDAQTFTITVDPPALTPPRVTSIGTVHLRNKGIKLIDVFFNEPLSPRVAASANNFIVVTPIPGSRKKGHQPKYKRLSFAVRYIPSSNSVALTLRQPTKKHLVLTIRRFLPASNGLELGADITIPVQ